ncbi:hypothetical protein chiPu_0030705, partial [Chiloscyllium punctatum]|nr:hypothetical protein [Chiloscyllium punctatum]
MPIAHPRRITHTRTHTHSYRVLYRYLTAGPTLFTGSDYGRQRSPLWGSEELLQE